MRVLFATAELAPVTSVGGLGAAAAGLGTELRRQGLDVEFVLPDYGGIALDDEMVVALEQIPMRLAILGSGESGLSAHLHRLAQEHPRSFAFVEGYDESLSHLMFAGADAHLMPSRLEPCGLTQMQAMRYGAVPVTTAVGGLVDTVVDADLHRNGTGFVAGRTTSEDLLAAMSRAARRLRDTRQSNALRRRIMAVDWSWGRPAGEYSALSRELVG
jgi:starch synthase